MLVRVPWLFVLFSLCVSGTAVENNTNEDPSIPLVIGLRLKQQREVEAVRELSRITDPASATYGSHWTPSQVVHFFAPKSESVARVVSWLADAGIRSSHLRRSHQGHEVTLVSRRSTLRRLFPSRSSHLGAQIASSIPVPPRLRDHVDFIIVFPAAGTKSRSRDLATDAHHTPEPPNRRGRELPRRKVEIPCHQQTTPACLRSLYHIPNPDTTSHLNNSLGIHIPSWSTYLPEDLDTFFEKHAPDLVGHRPAMAPINGGYQNLDLKTEAFNLEANLDFEYAMALTHPLPVTNIQVGSHDHPGLQIGTMLAAFDKYYCGSLDPSIDPIPPDIEKQKELDCGTTSPPKVISISYAWPEHHFPSEYLKRQCLEFLKLSLQGVTVIVATGDAGVGSHPDGYCLDPDNADSNTTTSGNFAPSWPASCPWVTAVGGTSPRESNDEEQEEIVVAWRNQPSASAHQRQQPPASVVNEVAYRRLFLNKKIRTSSGGFSNIFPTPEYQSQSVNSYLRHMNLTSKSSSAAQLLSSRFNHTGRGYPDISALASGYRIVTNGKWATVHGTSAAAPVVASLVAKINEARLRAGKSTVGFLNPVLYAHPEMFNDVTDGANAGCGLDKAFPATEEWDAVTGLGSLDFERMLNVFMDLP